jgi:PAS domain-containing protein
MPRNARLAARVRLGLAALRDAAKRRLAGKEVRQHRQDLEAIFNAVPVGMLLVDDRVIISEINDVAARLVGKTAGEISDSPGRGAGLRAQP